MALNLKTLLPLDHPEVTFPKKSKMVCSTFTSFKDDESLRDNLKEKEIADDVKMILHQRSIKLLDKITGKN